jgi:hypothetical protein
MVSLSHTGAAVLGAARRADGDQHRVPQHRRPVPRPAGRRRRRRHRIHVERHQRPARLRPENHQRPAPSPAAGGDRGHFDRPVYQAARAVPVVPSCEAVHAGEEGAGRDAFVQGGVGGGVGPGGGEGAVDEGVAGGGIREASGELAAAVGVRGEDDGAATVPVLGEEVAEARKVGRAAAAPDQGSVVLLEQAELREALGCVEGIDRSEGPGRPKGVLRPSKKRGFGYSRIGWQQSRRRLIERTWTSATYAGSLDSACRSMTRMVA